MKHAGNATIAGYPYRRIAIHGLNADGYLDYRIAWTI